MKLDLFDSVDLNKDGKLNVDEYLAYYRGIEAHYTKEYGHWYHLSDDELRESHAHHDFDGNGEITKDEIIWSSNLKTKFFKTMKLTAPMVAIFLEDLSLF
jgi:hypothetical protein